MRTVLLARRVYSHGTTRLPLERYLWLWYWWLLLQCVDQIQVRIKSRQWPVITPTYIWYFAICKVSTRNTVDDLNTKLRHRWDWYAVRKLGQKYTVMMFNPYRSNVEFNSTSLSVVPGPMLSSNRHVILQCFMLVFLNYCHLMDTFEHGKLEIFRKINLDQTVGILDKIWNENHTWLQLPNMAPQMNFCGMTQ